MDHQERVARFKKLFHLDAPSQVRRLMDGDGKAFEPADAATSLQEREREELRRLAFGGVPDEPRSLRGLTWLVLLECPQPQEALSAYDALVSECRKRLEQLPAPMASRRAAIRDDRFLHEIEADVHRTFPELAWFGAPLSGSVNLAGDPYWKRLELAQQREREAALESAAQRPPQATAADAPQLSLEPPAGGDPTGSSDVDVPPTPTAAVPSTPLEPPLADVVRGCKWTRRDRLLRPLFTYATLNPGVGYVQGFNSIMAVFLYVYENSEGLANEEQAEALAFISFSKIIAQLQDLYVTSLDGSISPMPNASPRRPSPAPTGLGATLQRFTALMTWIDPPVASSMANKGLDPALFVFKWLTTLFSTTFALPDLVRVWDRLFILHTSAASSEALSPVLGHLLDLSLATVLFERPRVVSPYSDFQKCLTTLQDPQIDGHDVDVLLNIAWEIRGRRLPRPPAPVEQSPPSKPARASQSEHKPGALSAWRQRLQQQREADIEAAASVAREQQAAMPAQTSASQSASPVTQAQKSLPPPPDEIEAAVLAALPPPPSADDYPVGDDDEDSSINWSSLRDSLRKYADESDAAAALQKTRTNLAIAAQMRAADLSRSTNDSDAAARLSKATSNWQLQAQMLRESLTQQAAARSSRLRDSFSAAGGRLMASTGSERAGGPPRPGSPEMEPFSPPGWKQDRESTLSPRKASEDSASDTPRSPGQRPLLLSDSARPARSRSNSGASEQARSHSPSYYRGSADLTVPPLGIVRSPSGRSAGGHQRSASSAIVASSSREHQGAAHARSSSAMSPEDVPLASLQISKALQAAEAEEAAAASPTGAKGLRRSYARRVSTDDMGRKMSAVPSGRGWQLSDEPVKSSPVEPVEETEVLTEPHDHGASWQNAAVDTPYQPVSASHSSDGEGSPVTDRGSPTLTRGSLDLKSNAPPVRSKGVLKKRAPGPQRADSPTSSRHGRQGSTNLTAEACSSVNAFLAGDEGSDGPRRLRKPRTSSRQAPPSDDGASYDVVDDYARE